MLPTVSITKSDGNTGVVRPGADGICALIGPAASGTQNQAASFAKPKSLTDEFTAGLLPEAAAWMLQFTGKPVVTVRSAASTTAVLSAVTHSGAGTSVVTASGTPVDDFAVVVKFVAGGTVGTAGATYQVSLDGGATFGPVKALGTANTIVITYLLGSTGITLALAAGTVLAGQTESVTATAARMSNTDLVTALEALRVSSLRFEHVHIVGGMDATMLATLDAWRLARDAEGRYYTGSGNTRLKNSGETEAAYKTAMDGLYGSAASTGLLVGSDGFDCTSPLSGLTQPREFALAVVTRGMSVQRGVDAARVKDGPLSGVSIKDSRGGPKYHDEALFPGLDDSRFTVARTFDQEAGVYVCNPNLFSASGSDYVYWQHMRTMNRACEIAKQMLTQRLSDGVRKQSDEQGNVRIIEVDAAEIDQLISSTIKSDLNGQVTDAGFILSRTDDLGSNGPITITGDVWIVSLAYAKKFAITAKFTRTVPATA